MKSRSLVGLVSGIVCMVFQGCFDMVETGDNEPVVSSRAYKGHESDADVTNFVNAYPAAAGSRLDDCVLCHTGGEVPGKRGLTKVNSCDYCHYIGQNDSPFTQTLNSYGASYNDGGRSIDALKAIGSEDSDDDGYTNIEEITEFFFPGNEGSNPSKPACPIVTLTVDSLKKFPSHTQFMLSNTHKQQYDDYVTYTGIRISVLLEQLGVAVDEVEGVTVFAPDGYAKTFTREQITREYPKSMYYTGLDDGGLGQNMGFVNYPETMEHADLENGDTIPDDQYLILAYQRDFEDIETAYIDTIELRINGEGPLRSVRPQDPASMPDRGSKYPQEDEYDCNEDLDHNAGDNVRGVTIIRIDPMPTEYEEFDNQNAGWSFLEAGKIVVYGYGIQ